MGPINIYRVRRKFAIFHHRALGDTIVLTGLIRDLQLSYPGKFDVSVNVGFPDVFRHNPHVLRAGKYDPTRPWYPANYQFVHADYGPGIREQRHETIHFLSYFHRDFANKTGIAVPVLYPYPDLHLSDAERKNPIIDGRYWVIVPGGKNDFKVKHWHPAYWQAVVDNLRDRGIRCVQVGATASDCWNPKLDGVLDLAGRTNIRDLFRLIHHSDGVVCGITSTMHAAAALKRPCVVIGGGIEAWWWEGYVNENKGFGIHASGNLAMPHRYLHTIGLLPCCPTHGCWKKKVLPEGCERRICHHPVQMPGKPIPKCLEMITPNHVIEAIMTYYEDRSLPPISIEKTAIPIVVGNMEGIGNKPAQIAEVPTRKQVDAIARPLPDHGVLDHPIIGGKFTLFVLMYGNYYDMHREMLYAIKETCPPQRIELRIGSNELCDASLGLIQEFEQLGLVKAHYRHRENAKKYPVMREMFHDAGNPIRTPYLIWFDDDTICNKDADWLTKLAATIVAGHEHGFRMFGPERWWKIQPGQAGWIKQAPWYRGRPFRDRGNNESPTGIQIHFASGSFWALDVATMRACDIPDVRINHNGGDYMIGEQLHQGGWKLKGFANRKEQVNWSAYKRRGYAERHAGMI